MTREQRLSRLDHVGEAFDGEHVIGVQRLVSRRQLLRTLRDLVLEPRIELLQLLVLHIGELFESAALLFQKTLFQRTLHRKLEVRLFPRFADVAVDLSLVDGIDGSADIGVAREQHPNHPRPKTNNQSQKLDTIQHQHTQIKTHKNKQQ